MARKTAVSLLLIGAVTSAPLCLASGPQPLHTNHSRFFHERVESTAAESTAAESESAERWYDCEEGNSERVELLDILDFASRQVLPLLDVQSLGRVRAAASGPALINSSLPFQQKVAEIYAVTGLPQPSDESSEEERKEAQQAILMWVFERWNKVFGPDFRRHVEVPARRAAIRELARFLQVLPPHFLLEGETPIVTNVVRKVFDEEGEGLLVTMANDILGFVNFSKPRNFSKPVFVRIVEAFEACEAEAIQALNWSRTRLSCCQ